MRRSPGFTLIELLVVLAIVATLLSLAAPRYFTSVDQTKETVLKQNLAGLRDALDKYYADRGRYPDTLEDLVRQRYLRGIPVDPITGRNDTWVAVPPTDAREGGVWDVKSGAPGKARDGTLYAEW